MRKIGKEGLSSRIGGSMPEEADGWMRAWISPSRGGDVKQFEAVHRKPPAHHLPHK